MMTKEAQWAHKPEPTILFITLVRIQKMITNNYAFTNNINLTNLQLSHLMYPWPRFMLGIRLPSQR